MSTYAVNVQIHLSDDEALPLERVRQAVAWVLRRHDKPASANLSVVVTDNAEIQALNRRFRGVDRPTGVLSFPADAEPLPDGTDEDADYLGDLIVSLPYIQRQAADDGHDWHDELILNVVHGTLHLLGYDHDTPENQARMWQVQAEALDALGVPITVPHFDFPDSSDEDPASDAPEPDRKLS